MLRVAWQALQEIPVTLIPFSDTHHPVSIEIQGGYEPLWVGGNQIAPLRLRIAVICPRARMPLVAGKSNLHRQRRHQDTNSGNGQLGYPQTQACNGMHVRCSGFVPDGTRSSWPSDIASTSLQAVPAVHLRPHSESEMARPSVRGCQSPAAQSGHLRDVLIAIQITVPGLSGRWVVAEFTFNIRRKRHESNVEFIHGLGHRVDVQFRGITRSLQINIGQVAGGKDFLQTPRVPAFSCEKSGLPRAPAMPGRQLVSGRKRRAFARHSSRLSRSYRVRASGEVSETLIP